MILHYIITAWRCILKFKTQNLIAVLGLSVALFCFSICLYIARYVYSTDNCFEQRNRIVQFSTHYFDIRHNCGGDCGSCGYCEALYPKVTQTLADIYMMEEKSC